MRQTIIALLSLLCLTTTFVACNDYETYGDKKKKERSAISQFLADSAITVISEDAREEVVIADAKPKRGWWRRN